MHPMQPPHPKFNTPVLPLPSGTPNLAATHLHHLTLTIPTRLLHHDSNRQYPHLPNNHPLVVLTNITRQIIDKAHTNSTNIHPNTTLHKIFNHANIFANFESQKEASGNASQSSLKYSEIWSSIANSCQILLKPKNPQTLPLTPPNP